MSLCCKYSRPPAAYSHPSPRRLCWGDAVLAAHPHQAAGRTLPPPGHCPGGRDRRPKSLGPRGRAHRGATQRHLRAVSQAVNDGHSLADALVQTGDYFPALFREMVEVGEQSGHLDGILHQLAEHYSDQIKLRRDFVAAITWPAIQLTLAILVIGFLIGAMGVVQEMTGNRNIDPLGFGLIGTRGLAIYFGFLAAAGALLWLFVRAASRGLMWTRPVQRLALRIPGIGGPLNTMALARLAWSMHLTMNAGMDLRLAMKLSLRSARNARFTDHIPIIDAEISAGNSLHDAFCRAGGYPSDFLDTLAVAEQSGQVVETMAHLSRQYREQARAAMTALAVIAGWIVWLVVAAIIVTLIFRLFSFYVAQIQAAGRL